MSFLINNLIFIGYSLFPKLKSRKLNDFNISELANFLDVHISNLSHWIHGYTISNINLSRICQKLSKYYNIPITPEIMQTQNLEQWLSDHRPKYQFQEQSLSLIKDSPDLLDTIVFLLRKHESLQPLILQFLKCYDQK